MLLQDDPYASIKLLISELNKIGYNYDVFDIHNHSHTYYRFIKPFRRAWLTRGEAVSYPFTHSGIVSLSIYKDRAYSYLKQYNYTVPETYICTQDDVSIEKIHYLINTFKTLVVKPADASLSKGLSMNIRNSNQALLAVKKASLHNKQSKSIIIQQQVTGEEVRFVIVGGKTKAALLKKKANITGDGVLSVKQLIKIENDKRSKINCKYIQYPLITEELTNKKIVDYHEVIGRGETMVLSSSSMVKEGASIYNILNNVHPSYLNSVESITSNIGASFIVIDFLINDYSQPQTSNNYCFLEFNTAPELKLFYSCRDGNHYDIVSDLVPLIDSTLAI